MRSADHVPESGEEVPAYRPPSFLSSFWWDVSRVIAIAAAVIVCAAVAVLVMGRPWHWRERLDAVLPSRPVIDEQAARQIEAFREKFAVKLKNDAGVRGKGGSVFGLGSSKEQVLSVQGRPDEATESVWRYGKSEVYFIQDRVVAWISASESPLKAQ